MQAGSTSTRILGRSIFATIVLLVLALPGPALASAETVTVTSAADEPDLVLGGGCVTAAGKCTLRAAIEEVNASNGASEVIDFDGSVFDGGIGSAIELSSDLPPIVKGRTQIDGGRCTTATDVEGPCVGLQGTNSGATLQIEANQVAIEGIDVFGASTGIELTGSREFTISGDWFGTDFAEGSNGLGDGTAVVVGPGSGEGRIGGKEQGAGNFFVYGITGLEIDGASNVSVLGDRFGLLPDGHQAEQSDFNTAIDIASDPASGHKAIDNVIGSRLSAAALATPECDGGCNVIGNAGTAIGTGGLNSSEKPVSTVIRGNYIGLGSTGAEWIPANDVVNVSTSTIVGGPVPGDRNWIDGEILAGSGPWEIRGNQIGVNFEGAVPPYGQSDGVTVYAEGSSEPAGEPVIAENLVEVAGGWGITVDGRGATILGNEIAGAEIGILLKDADDGNGSLIEENLVEEAATVGILIENDFNEIVGNRILGSGIEGIGIAGRNRLAATGNSIGGGTPSSENDISSSGTNAIVIGGAEGSENEIARNHGTSNGDAFIALWNSDPRLEPIGPNGGITPPQLSSVSSTEATGGAEPGAIVRLFRKAGSEPGELESFLGQAVADSHGAWQIHFETPIPAGTNVAASQTSLAGGTSELAFGATPASVGGEPNAGANPTNPHNKVTTPPQTKIFKNRESGRRATATFAFRSTKPGSTFECRLGRNPFRGCKSPIVYRNLAPGKYRFEVRAIEDTGNVDSSPARRTFVIPRLKHR